MSATKIFVLLVCLAWSAPAQQEESTGAKVFGVPQASSASPVSGKRPFYYLTRPAPNGGEERVFAPYVFPSNSRAFLYVLPTEDGHLYVLYSDHGQQRVYFPFDRTKDKTGDPDRVRKGESIKIPLAFDEKPDQTLFTVVVVTDDLGTRPLRDDLHKPGGRGEIGGLLEKYLHPKSLVAPPSDEGVAQSDPPIIYSRFPVQNQ